MSFNTTVQLEMPETFPNLEFDVFVAVGRTLLESKSPLRREFDPATNLIAWRYRACSEFLEMYLHSSEATFDDIYHQERNFFGMLYSGESCIEATCYAAYALIAHPAALGLPFSTREQNFRLLEFLKTLKDRSAVSNLAMALERLLNSDEWKTWSALRNRVTHRTNLPQIIRGRIGGDAAVTPRQPLEFAGTSSTPNLSDTSCDLRDGLFAFITESLRSLLIATVALVGPR
jgi:hypothetical protein